MRANMFSLFPTDSTIKHNVENEIKYDPAIEAADQIAVMVDNGVVTQIGTTPNYIDCYNAERPPSASPASKRWLTKFASGLQSSGQMLMLICPL